MRFSALLVLVLAVPLPLRAQAASDGARPDTTRFLVLRENDTVAVESVVREGVTLQGELTVRVQGGIRETWRAVIAPDGTAPLVEAAVFPPGQPEGRPERQARVIFRDDSASVDAITATGAETRVFGTRKGALPYLNLSFGLLEQALRRARALGGDSAEVAFFNLGGGQTAVGEIRALGADSTALTLGSVEFRLLLDRAGRLVGAAIPSQRLRAIRR